MSLLFIETSKVIDVDHEESQLLTHALRLGEAPLEELLARRVAGAALWPEMPADLGRLEDWADLVVALHRHERRLLQRFGFPLHLVRALASDASAMAIVIA